MAEAKRDQNRVPTLIGVSSSDATTPTLVYVDPTTNRLCVNAVVTAGFGNQTGVVDGEAVEAADTGTLILGTDGSNYQVLAVDSSGNLQVDVLTMPSVTVDSEFPAAAAITDNYANPTTTSVMGMTMVWDGSAWDRAPGTSTAGMLVNLGTNNDVTLATLPDTAAGDLAAINSAVSGTLTVTGDDAGSLTVDSSGGFAVQIQDGGGTNLTSTLVGADQSLDVNVTQSVALDVSAATVTVTGSVTADLGGNNDVTIDGSSIVHLEDAAHSSGDAGVMMLGVENNEGTSLSGGNNDYTPIGVTAHGYPITVPYTTSTALTDAETNEHARRLDMDIGEVFDPVYNYVYNGTSWDRLRGDTSGSHISQIIPGTDATHLGKAEDAQHANGDTGVMALAVRNDTLAALGASDGDYAPLQVNASGALYIQEGAALDVSGATVTVDNGGTFAVQVDGDALTALQLIDNSIYVDDADWTADTSSHTLVGGVTQATPSANTDGDTTPLITNALRELRVAIPESDLATASTTHVKKYYTNAGAVTDGIVWSPAAGKRWYITDIFINVSAAATVTLEDDKTGGDDPVWKAELAANSGWSHSFKTPLYSGEDAADLIITTSAGNVYVTVTGYEI